MKKVVTYCLLILFLFVFSNETISYFTKKITNGIVTDLSDFEGEEDSESEKSDEKEKKEFSENLFNLDHCRLASFNHLNYIRSGDFIFSTSDYSQTVYSPPEYTVI
ncbi:MAG: hypothetical protein V4608_11425 [Bacteroidota bacterium]